MSDDERPRKSWREIDKQRDRSQHRREEKPVVERKRGPGSQKSYRAQLDRLFETGKIADLVAQKAPSTSGGEAGESRIKALGAIKRAMDRDTITRELDAFMEKFGALPDDLEVLEKALEHRSSEQQLLAMQRIDALLDQEQPRRKRAMVGQLKLIRDLSDDPTLTELARKLLGRLE
jgi:acetyl-CoA carboxylase carboxyltransferase component